MSDEPETLPRILVVDDRPENIAVLVEALGKHYTVIAAIKGEQALRLIAQSPPPDLVLLDIMMPDIDGYEVCRRMKAAPESRDIPVIFLTALTEEESELRGLTLGAVDYVHKPISIPLVQCRVASHLELSTARRRLAAQVHTLEEAAQLRDDVDRITRHDLKGPLTPILTFTEMLLRDPGISDDQRAMIATIRSSGMTMLNQINRSLDLYRMETGRYSYQPAMQELSDIVRRVLAELSPLIQEKGIRIENNLPWTVLPLEEMLGLSLFSNLIKNAIEATPPKGVITIGVETTDNRATIKIVNPSAVPVEIRPNFFEKYVTAGKQCGTGLGTYSARLMARTMGGDISMEADEELGTRISVLLPLRSESPP